MPHEELPQVQEPSDDKPESQPEVVLSRSEREEQERARENALPFNERTTWRKRHMYRGWMLEPVELNHEAVAGSSAFPIT